MMQQEIQTPTQAELSRKAARLVGEPIGKLNYSIPEAAKALGIGRSKLYELITSGELATIKIGKRRLVPVDACADLQAALRGRAA